MKSQSICRSHLPAAQTSFRNACGSHLIMYTVATTLAAALPPALYAAKPGSGGGGGGSLPKLPYRVSWIEWAGASRVVFFDVDRTGQAVGGARGADNKVLGLLAQPEPTSSVAEVVTLDSVFDEALNTGQLNGWRIAYAQEITESGGIAGYLIGENDADTTTAPAVALFRASLISDPPSIEIVETFAGNGFEILEMNEIGDILVELAGGGGLRVYRLDGGVQNRPLGTSEYASDSLNSRRQTLVGPTGTSYLFSFDTGSLDNLSADLKRGASTRFYHLADSGAAYGTLNGVLSKWRGPSLGFQSLGTAGSVRSVSSASNEEVLIQNNLSFVIYRDAEGLAAVELSPSANSADDLTRWGQASGYLYDAFGLSQPVSPGGRGVICGNPMVTVDGVSANIYSFILVPQP